MAVMFDTARVARGERADQLRAALADTSISSVELLDERDTVDARLEVWQWGTSSLFRAVTPPVRLYRTERQARRDPVPILALAVQERSDGLHQQFAPMSRIRPGTMMGMDMTEPFEFSWSDDGASRALMVPLEQLDLPADLVRQAVPRLAQSPLYELVRNHVVALFDEADRLSMQPSAADVAQTSVDLARALMVSLAPGKAMSRQVGAQTLSPRVREYVRQNLRDHRLNAASIAAAHNISVRQLYNVWSEADTSLEQFIIRRRLCGIRAELSLPSAQFRSIASVAQGWGFRNISHFTRRFTGEFGVTPREWRTTQMTP